MALPALPTDNLYKFIALSGVVLFLFGATVPYAQRTELRARLTELRLETATLTVDSEAAVAESREASAQLDRWMAEVKSGAEPPTEAVLDQLREAQRKRQGTGYELDKRSRQLDIRTDAIQELTRELRWLSIAGAVLMGFGSFIAIRGFQLWYLRTQKYQDAALARDALSNDPPKPSP